MDTMYQFGRKMTFTKRVLDEKLGEHAAEFYDEERFITIGEQKYALRGRSRTEENAWEYSEIYEASRDQVTAYHITTDYRDIEEDKDKWK